MVIIVSEERTASILTQKMDAIRSSETLNRLHGVTTQKTTTDFELRGRVFGRSRVQISAWRPDILTEAFRSFLQSLQANAGIII
jgi:hypothetical protein